MLKIKKLQAQHILYDPTQIKSCLTNNNRHTHPFNGPLSRTTLVSRYQKGKTNLDFTEARDSEWQWHQLGRMQVCTSLKTDNHASTPPLNFLQAGCPFCHPTKSFKALKANCSPHSRSKSAGIEENCQVPANAGSYRKPTLKRK